MSDELKDFRYYADKAEDYITLGMDSIHAIPYRDRAVNIAAVYAELAKAAPKAEPERDWPMRDNN